MPRQTVPTTDQIFERTCEVVADWAKKPRQNITGESELKKLRPGKTRALGLALQYSFENDYAPKFDEVRFDELWSHATIKTVQHAYWIAVLSFS